MEGYEVFIYAGIISVIVFYIVSYLLKKKYPQKISYLLPVAILAVCSAVFLVLQIFIIKDGWIIMENFLFGFFILLGAIIGTFLPLLYLKLFKHKEIL